MLDEVFSLIEEFLGGGGGGLAGLLLLNGEGTCNLNMY